MEETYKFGEETRKNGDGDPLPKYICQQKKISVNVERFRKRTWMSCGKKSDKRKQNQEKPTSRLLEFTTFGTVTARKTRNRSTKNKKKKNALGKYFIISS